MNYLYKDLPSEKLAQSLLKNKQELYVFRGIYTGLALTKLKSYPARPIKWWRKLRFHQIKAIDNERIKLGLSPIHFNTIK